MTHPTFLKPIPQPSPVVPKPEKPKTVDTYVLVCIQALQYKPALVMVNKTRPAHLKGMFNLPGGKVEAGEQVEAAAIREVREETGLSFAKLQYKGVISRPDVGSYIHCFHTFVEPHAELYAPADEPERPFWADWEVMRAKKLLVPSLRVVVPLILAGDGGWLLSIHDSPVDERREVYEVFFNN